MVVVETQRLQLRWLGYDDAPFILNLLNQPSFIDNIGDKGVRDLDDARAYLDSAPIASYQRFGFGLYRVGLKGSDEPVGICGLLKRDELDDVDLGFAFLPEYWSQGYGRESATAVMQLARDHFKLRTVIAITAPHNHASMKLLEKLNFISHGLIQLNEGDEAVRLFVAVL